MNIFQGKILLCGLSLLAVCAALPAHAKEAEDKGGKESAKLYRQIGKTYNLGKPSADCLKRGQKHKDESSPRFSDLTTGWQWKKDISFGLTNGNDVSENIEVTPGPFNLPGGIQIEYGRHGRLRVMNGGQWTDCFEGNRDPSRDLQVKCQKEILNTLNDLNNFRQECAKVQAAFDAGKVKNGYVGCDEEAVTCAMQRIFAFSQKMNFRLVAPTEEEHAEIEAAMRRGVQNAPAEEENRKATH